MAESPKIYRPSPGAVGFALCQGEIVRGVIQAHLKIETIGSQAEEMTLKDHPLAIILSQDCDLEQDHFSRTRNQQQDKLIPNVLFCEMVTAQQLKASQGLNSSLWGRVAINSNERYHFFQRVPLEDDACDEGLEELGIDFKRYFTIPTDEVYQRLELGEIKRCSVLCSPYLEHLSSRFAFYLSRVALPTPHVSE